MKSKKSNDKIIKAKSQEHNMIKAANPIDIYVGQRLKMRRLLMGFSQSKLGKELNLTFQQIQKYEKGLNRIGASRLFQISKILNVPVQYFFDSIEDFGENSLNELYGGDISKKSEKEGYQVMSYINTAEGLKLNKSICVITDPNLRRKLIEVITTISDLYVKIKKAKTEE